MDKAAWVSPEEELKNLVIVFLLIIEFCRLFKKPEFKFVDIIALQDTSQSQKEQLSANDIVARFRYAQDLSQRATFRYSTICESYKTEAIEASTGTWRNGVARNTENGIRIRFKEIESFHERVATIAGQQRVNDQQVLLPHNGIFKTIVDEFNVFDCATEKVLLVNSGLFECSPVFDSQSPEDVALLHANPKAIARRFKKAYKIKKVGRVKMELRYEPSDKADWERFLKMAGVVSLVFTPKGARVSIKTTTKIHEL